MSPDTLFCGQCGASLAATAKFCAKCGSPQEAAPVAAGASDPSSPSPSRHEPPPPPPPASPGPGPQAPRIPRPQAGADRLRRVDPEAGELASQLAAQLTGPGAIVAAASALGAFGAMLVFGLVAAVITPDKSIIGFYGQDSGIIEEALRLSVGSLLARVEADGETGTITPMLFILVPLLGAAAGAWSQAERLRGMTVRGQLACGAAAGVPLALLSVILGLAAGGDVVFRVGNFSSERVSLDFVIGSVILYAFLWGAIGGAAGVALRLRQAGGTPDLVGAVVPHAARPWLRLIWLPARALAVALLAATAIGVAVWEVQTWKGEDSAKLAFIDRSGLTATIENAAFAGEIGLGVLGLGQFAEGQQRSDNPVEGQVLPVSDDIDQEDRAKFFDIEGDGGDSEGSGQRGTYRLFDYRHVYAPYAFIPLLMLMVGVPLLLMLYGGFATARCTGTRAPQWGALYGVSVGVVWSLAQVILRAVADTERVSGDSLFACALLIGAAVGAIGGALATAGTPGATGAPGVPPGGPGPGPGEEVSPGAPPPP